MYIFKCLGRIEKRLRGNNIIGLYRSRRMKDERVAIDKLKDAGCHIIPMESFLYGFMTTSEHPSFREVSKLVRERIMPQD